MSAWWQVHAGAAAFSLAALTGAHATALSAQPLPTPRLDVLDCGTLAGRNLRTYGLPAEPRDMSVACALLVNGNRTLLWETGLGDRFAAGRETPRDPGWRVGRTLKSQSSGCTRSCGSSTTSSGMRA
jgi:hypothetical protein